MATRDTWKRRLVGYALFAISFSLLYAYGGKPLFSTRHFLWMGVAIALKASSDAYFDYRDG